MIKYAAIKDNLVVDVLVFDDPSQKELADISLTLGVDLLLPLTNNAGIGSKYIDGVLRPIQPYLSWVWNDSSKEWDAPTAKPLDDKKYWWNESTLTWDLITPPTE